MPDVHRAIVSAPPPEAEDGGPPVYNTSALVCGIISPSVEPRPALRSPLPCCSAEAPVAASSTPGLRPEEIGGRSARQLDEPNRATSPVHYRDEQTRATHDAVTGDQE
jgi:hypothetical protein